PPCGVAGRPAGRATEPTARRRERPTRYGAGMRLGVVDFGSNTVHLLVVDARPGAAPVPAFSSKTDLRLAELMGPGDTITEEGAAKLVQLAAQALELAEDKGCSSVLAFATSAIREAANG